MFGRGAISCGRWFAGPLVLGSLVLSGEVAAQRAAAVAAPAVLAAGEGEPGPALKIVPGDRVRGKLDGDEVHAFEFDVVAGSRITVRTSRLSGNGKIAFRVLDPDDEVVISPLASIFGLKVSKLKHYDVLKTGTYRVEVLDMLGEGGEYGMRVFKKYVQRIKTVVAVDGETPPNPVVFDATAGSTIRLFLAKAPKPKGFFSKVGNSNKPAALLPEVSAIMAPESGNLAVPGTVKTSEFGKKIWAKKVPLPDFGTYQIDITGAAGSVGYAKVLLKLRFKKGGELHFVD